MQCTLMQCTAYYIVSGCFSHYVVHTNDGGIHVCNKSSPLVHNELCIVSVLFINNKYRHHHLSSLLLCSSVGLCELRKPICNDECIYAHTGIYSKCIQIIIKTKHKKFVSTQNHNNIKQNNNKYDLLL